MTLARLILTALLFTSSTAWALPRTVCLQFKVADDRTMCPVSGDPGAKNPCVPGGHAEIEGWTYELWDKDTGSDDEFIAAIRVGGLGRRCFTFEWENSSFSRGEPNPDLYVRLRNRVQATGGDVAARAVDGNNNDYGDTTWRNGTAADSNAFVARNCAVGATCQIAVGRSLVPTNDTTSNRGLMVQNIDSAQRALQTFHGSVNDTGNDIRIYVDDLADLPRNCSTACAPSRHRIYMPFNLAHEGDRSTHEMGHVFQMREFNQNWLRVDCSRNGDGWDGITREFDSCATQEGFGSFVGTVSWYEPNDTSSVPFFQGVNMESSVPLNIGSCSANSDIPYQVARGFWDLDDFNNEAATSPASVDDVSSKSTTWILDRWDLFSNGFGNRDDGESGNNGVNVHDYSANAGLDAAADGTLVSHNCLDAQVP